MDVNVKEEKQTLKKDLWDKLLYEASKQRNGVDD